MKKRDRIYKALEHRDEIVVIDLYFKNYDGSNFYIALVYNKIIKKFKVLYVPLDLVNKDDDIEDYFCYQFIFAMTVEYILKTLHENEDKYREESFRKRAVKSNKKDYIAMSVHASENDYEFDFSEYIDRDYQFLFDVIVILFEHSPSIVHEVCEEILKQFNSPYKVLKYNEEIKFDLFNDDYDKMFSDEVIKSHKYSSSDVEYLDIINEKYCAVINNHKFILEDDMDNDLLKIYSSTGDIRGEEALAVIEAIREDNFNQFSRVEIELDDIIGRTAILYSYGIDKDNQEILVFNKLDDRDVPLKLIDKDELRILKCNDEFRKDINDYLNSKYTKEKVKEIEEELYEKEETN